MYNKERKQLFIDHDGGTESYGTLMMVVFNACEKLESLYNKDVCEFAYNEVMSLYTAAIPHAVATRINYTSVLKRYCTWCIQRGYIETNAFDGLDIDNTYSYDGIQYQLIKDPKMLKERLEILYPDLDRVSSEHLRIGIVWALYMGVPKNKIMNIKIADVNLNDNILMVADKEYKIPLEAKPLFDALVNTDEFLLKRSGNIIFFKGRAEPDILFSTLMGGRSDQVIRVVASSMARASQKVNTEFRLTIKDCIISGAFYRTYLREKNGEGLSYDDILEKGYEEQTVEHRKRLYRIWKKTFYNE